MKCDVCGYHPRSKDAHNLTIGTNFSNDCEETQEIIHVICYNCGHEWVE